MYEDVSWEIQFGLSKLMLGVVIIRLIHYKLIASHHIGIVPMLHRLYKNQQKPFCSTLGLGMWHRRKSILNSLGNSRLQCQERQRHESIMISNISCITILSCHIAAPFMSVKGKPQSFHILYLYCNASCKLLILTIFRMIYTPITKETSRSYLFPFTKCMIVTSLVIKWNLSCQQQKYILKR